MLITRQNINQLIKHFLAKTNSKLHLGFYYSDTDFRTPTIDQSEEHIESLNSNNSNLREGSVWLMVQEADGVWYAKHVNIKRFTNEEFPLIENL